MLKRWAGVVALVLTFSSAAQADWLLTPSVGTTFGGDTDGAGHRTYSVSFGRLDEEVIGFEADFSYAPDFFAGVFGANIDDSSVLTMMANALVGPELGGRFRPYVTGGVGLMRMRVVSDGGLFETHNHELGYNVGVGAMGFVSDHVGLRGDFRYVRSFENEIPSWTRGVDVDIAPGNFDYWRAAVGVTFGFGE